MTDLPQWAVERADDLFAQILERATNTDYGIGVSLDARDLIARALAEAAKPKLPTMSTAFRTTVTGGGKYEMVFRFPNMDELHKAEDEWLSAVHGIEKNAAPEVG